MRPRAANGQQLLLLDLLARDPCALASHVRKLAVRRPAHSPDPSRPACRRLGSRSWNIAEHAWSLARIEGCARLQLYLERTYRRATWESDRAIWPAGTIAAHGWGWPMAASSGRGGATGVELELDVKRLDRYQPAVADVDPAWSAGVWWFTPRAQVCLLQQQLSDASGDGHHQVVTAPEGVAP
jgi:hypothetical protein